MKAQTENKMQKLTFLRLDQYNKYGMGEFQGFFNNTLKGIENCRAEIPTDFFYSKYEPESIEFYQITVFESYSNYDVRKLELLENLTEKEREDFIWNIWQGAKIIENRFYTKK